MMKTEELQIKDIYDVWYHPFWQQNWFIALGIIVTLTLIGLLGYWLYQKNKKEIILEPWEVALDALHDLKKNKPESPKLFYIQLTTILKRYLQSRYELSLIGTTDDEMLSALQQGSAVPKPVTDTIKTLLNGVQLIKFANQKAAQEQMQNALASSVQLVKSTKVVED